MLQEFDKSSENVSIYFLLTYLSEFFKDHEADRSNMISDMTVAHFVKWFESNAHNVRDFRLGICPIVNETNRNCDL